MILKEILDKQNINLLELSKMANIPYSTLREMVTGKTDFKNCAVYNFIKLSQSLGITVEELYIIINNTVISNKINLNSYITDIYKIPFKWNNKKATLDFTYKSKMYHLPLPQIKILYEERIMYYIQVAIWNIDDYISEIEFNERVKKYGK